MRQDGATHLCNAAHADERCATGSPLRAWSACGGCAWPDEVCCAAWACAPPPFQPPLVDVTPATPCWKTSGSEPWTNELLGGELKGRTRMVSHELSASAGERGRSQRMLVDSGAELPLARARQARATRACASPATPDEGGVAAPSSGRGGGHAQPRPRRWTDQHREGTHSEPCSACTRRCGGRSWGRPASARGRERSARPSVDGVGPAAGSHSTAEGLQAQ